ncbi:hypothetical protein MLD38_032249 [Melastoma candidum]|uniref:Uncharacterized protein n=1 Tax=Melastoma candidum TaxID=119954 RepID=A0ACB9M373_9MYRT|nr:hypothetical protein MLD38_032249 [Melastoma candidum]
MMPRDTEGVVQYTSLGEGSLQKREKLRNVSILPLVFLIFYEVSGGPFGVEDSVKAARPLIALLGFLLFPFVWSIPEALITAEMSTMFPETGDTWCGSRLLWDHIGVFSRVG